jgi:N-methylhydantoinase A/oxoprolinase/acetone carboxylase beta subunit
VRIGADSGGTFTDVVAADGRIVKLLSTPHDPGLAVRTGAAALAPDGTDVLAHGTTIATNALLERRVATVALYTTEGFADVIEIGRQDRPSLYDPDVSRPAPLVDRDRRLEVSERMAADGTVVEPYRPGSAPDAPPGTDAVAVCLLHADVAPAHEAALVAELRARGLDVCASHEVSPEMREYERTVTTVVNAALRPVCRSYLAGLHDAAREVVVMTSAGGLLDVERAAALPAALLLSGPAAGARAAAQVARACGFPDALSLDMGGTSTDVCLILDGAPAVTGEHAVAGFPVRLPSIDIHTIGAGGGSIARLDRGGALTVGPASAGADPGPACYGLGGTEPTVTDADLVLGRIPTDAAFGAGLDGRGRRLDAAAARDALSRAGVDAAGVVEVVNAGMEQALRPVSVVRGVDPAGLALVAFGGAGPLHACALAEAMGMTTVVVPAAAGVLSAVGLLVSPRHRELVRSWPADATRDGLDAALAALADEARGALGVEPCTVTTALDCRYAGQSHDLRVASVAEFGAAHERVNGYRRDDPVEVTALRAVAEAPAPCTLAEVLAGWAGRWTEPVVGPMVEGRTDCTIWVPDGWTGRAGPLGALVLTRRDA